jgi:hexulose-6-phosphate isomerase
MQGRLSNLTPYGYQVFPMDTWESEFKVASSLGFNHIEWVVGTKFFDQNPIHVHSKNIASQIDRSGVKVISACLDYLMDKPILNNRAYVDDFFKVSIGLNSVGCKILVIPYVDQSSMSNNSDLQDALISQLDTLVEICRENDQVISLETDLNPISFANLLSELPADCFNVNYDIGNSASLGFIWEEEFEYYGERIGLLHIKDRILHGHSVQLGTGDADIPKTLKSLLQTSFNGTITMQSFRGAGGKQETADQFRWLKEL